MKSSPEGKYNKDRGEEKELSSCHLDLSRCELTVDCPLRYQIGIEAKSDLTLAKRLGGGERSEQ